MCIGDFVQGHHQWGKKDIHKHTDGKGHSYACAQTPISKDLGGVMPTQTFQQCRNAFGKNPKCKVNEYAQKSPNHRPRHQAKTRLVINALLNPQTQCFTHGCQYGKLHKTQRPTVLAIGPLIVLVQRRR